MSEGFLPPLVARLVADTAEFKAKMGEAAVQAEEVSARSKSSYSRMAMVGKAAFLGLGAAAISFGAETVHLADQFEQAHARLGNAVHNVGGAFDSLAPQVDAVDSKMARFGYTSTETESALARLVAATKNPAKSIREMALAADIARGRNISLASATDLLVKVQTGHVALLGRLGIAVKDATGKTISQREAMQRLADLYGGAAQRNAETFAGKMQALKAEVENVGVKIGMALIPVLERAAGILLQVGQDVVAVSGFLSQHTLLVDALGVALAARLVPALLLAGRTMLASAAETLSLRFMYAADGATTLAWRLRFMGAAAIASKAALLGLGIVAVQSFLDLAQGDKVVKSLRDDLSKPLSSHLLGDLLKQSQDATSSLYALNHMSNWDAFTTGLLHPIQAIRLITGSTTDGINQVQDAIGRAYGNFHDLVTSLQGFPTPQAEAQTALVLQQMGVNAKDLGGNFGALHDRVVAWIAANQQSQQPTEQAAADITALGSKALSASDEVAALKDQLDRLAGKALSADEAAITFRNNIAQLDKALKASHGSMTLNTQAGRDARQQFDATAQSAIDLSTSIKNSTGSTDRAQAALHNAIQALHEHAGTSDAAKAALDRLRGAYDQLASAATAGSRKAVTAISDQAAAAKAAAESVGAAAGGGLAAGLQSQMGAVTTQAKLLADQLAKVTRLQLQIHSPSKVFHAIGQNVIQGLINGLQSMESHLQTQMDRVTAKLQAVRSAAASLKSSVASAIIGDAALSNVTGTGANGAVMLSDIFTQQEKSHARAASFLRELGLLRKRGLSAAYVSQIAGYGAAQGGQYADALMNASRQQLQQLSGLGASTLGIANRTGSLAATDVYGKHLTVLTREQTALHHDLRDLIHDLRAAQHHDKDKPLVVQLYLDGKHVYDTAVTQAQRAKQRGATTNLS